MALSRILARCASALIVGACGAGAVSAQPGPAGAGAPADYCLDESLARAHGLSDLYCVNLVGVPALSGASGYAKLIPTYSPYGVSVTPDGHHEYRLRFFIEGLPDPATLGPYTTYVAWVTTPVLHPVQKLGPVQNGTVELGNVAFNKFLVLITAEVSDGVAERDGRLVMRGASPSSRMEAHDLGQVAPLAVFAPGGASHAPSHEPSQDPSDEPSGEPSDAPSHAHHAGMDGAGTGVPGMDGASWAMPPMHPAVAGVPGMMGIRPRVAPFTPRADSGSAPGPVRTSTPVELADGATFHLEAGFVTRRIAGRELLMYAFNGQHPGPLLAVPQDGQITVRFVNRYDLPSAIHWHGLRLDYRFDGVPGMTQDLVQPGDDFTYQLKFPDPGLYWFHPHHREDIGMDLGLYANILVRSPRAAYYNPVNREAFLMLDDLLLDADGVVPYGAESANYMLMGRFGNTFLINGRTDFSLDVDRGETVRFFVTNASSTRTYNLSFGDVTLKLVGSDVGKFEREEWEDNLVIGPAERYIVEAHFPDSGTVAIQNRVQAINHRSGVFFPEVDTLGVIRVGPDPVERNLSATFNRLRVHDDVVADIDRYRPAFDRPVDHHLVARLDVQNLPPVVQQMMRFEGVYFNPVEWSGTMPMMNWVSTGEEVRWILEDPATGKQNMDIDWRFRVGDVVKIRLANDREAFHAMQHPVHIHGQRFLVLERDGVPVPNRVWKDTMILPAGSTADILLELSNPGKWMVHCHIAEHIDSGMMFVFDVE